LKFKFNKPLQFISSQNVSGWGKASSFTAAWETVLEAFSLTKILSGNYSAINLIHLLIFIAACLVLFIGWKRLPLSYALWTLLNLLLLFTVWRSMGRFVAVLFPLFIIVAHWLKNEETFQAFVIASSLFLALFSVMFSHLYWVA